jgi:hypothetical protein
MPVTMTCDADTLVLALATLGGATMIEMILIAKASKSISQAFSHTNLANVNEPLRAKVDLQYGNYRTKLVHFEAQKYFQS